MSSTLRLHAAGEVNEFAVGGFMFWVLGLVVVWLVAMQSSHVSGITRGIALGMAIGWLMTAAGISLSAFALFVRGAVCKWMAVLVLGITGIALLAKGVSWLSALMTPSFTY